MMSDIFKIKPASACAAAALVLVFTAAMNLSDTVVFSAKGLDLYNVKRVADKNGRDAFVIDDLSYARRAIVSVNDLVLSFNGPSRSLARDDAGLYPVRHASYESMNGDGVSGGGAAYFFKKEHGVEITSSKNLWLGNCSDLGSFTIELRLMPVSMKEGGVIFSNAGYASGIKTGIEFAMKGGRVTARFHRVFRDVSGKRVDVFLNRGRRLQEGKWHHYSVSFDRISGKLCTELDGVEQEAVYMTEEGEPFVNVYSPSFSCSDLPVVVIGKNYYGAIDELRISYRHIEDLKKETDVAVKPHRPAALTGRVPVNSEGVITSPVGEFPLTGTKVTLLEWEEVLKNNSFIWMEFRIADGLFDPNGPSPRWYRVTNRQRTIYLKKEGDLYLRGRYYQWRAHLIPSPDGSASPMLSGISLQYRLDPPPVPPLYLESVRTGDGTVTLRWKKNVEDDILGYRVYYGIQSGKYDGVIATAGGRRIGNDFTPRGTWVEIEINNAVIDENRANDRGGVLAYPLLKNNVLYFFAVTAYDTYRPGTPYNHESPVSKELTARPFPGSDITR